MFQKYEILIKNVDIYYNILIFYAKLIKEINKDLR